MMENNNVLKIVIIFSLVLFQISCQKDEVFIGYNDLLVNSPMLLWGSSIENMKNNYPNIEEFSNNNMFRECDLNGQIKFRLFSFTNNKLFYVAVSYGEYNNEEMELLKNNLQEKYGIYLIEDNGTIETWYINSNKDNQIVFNINKIENNTVNCSYINPTLREIDDKIIVVE